MPLREDQQEIFNRITEDKNGHSFMIIGEGQSGKTFLLKALEKHFVEGEKHRTIFIDLEQFSVENFWEGLISFLAKELGVENSPEAVHEFLKDNGHNIIIFMDEFGYFNPKYGGFFRSLTQIAEVRYICAARDISVMDDKEPTSAFTNVMRPLWIEPKKEIPITEEMTIAEVIVWKGVKAGELIDKYLCDSVKTCCPGTTLQLKTAAHMMGKMENLPILLKELNELPNR